MKLAAPLQKKTKNKIKKPKTNEKQTYNKCLFFSIIISGIFFIPRKRHP